MPQDVGTPAKFDRKIHNKVQEMLGERIKVLTKNLHSYVESIPADDYAPTTTKAMQKQTEELLLRLKEYEDHN